MEKGAALSLASITDEKEISCVVKSLRPNKSSERGKTEHNAQCFLHSKKCRAKNRYSFAVT